MNVCVSCPILYGRRDCVTLENNQAKVFFVIGWKTFLLSNARERERERETHLSFYCQRPRVLPVSTIRFWMESKIDVRPRQGYTVKSYGLLHPNGVDICNYITGELHHILHIATTPDAGWLKVFRKTLFTIFLLFLSPLFFFSFVPSSKPSKTRCAHDGARKWWQTCAITINIAPFQVLYEHKQDHLEFVSIRVATGLWSRSPRRVYDAVKLLSYGSGPKVMKMDKLNTGAK